VTLARIDLADRLSRDASAADGPADGVIEIDLAAGAEADDIGYEELAASSGGAPPPGSSAEPLDRLPLLGELPQQALALFLTRAGRRTVKSGERVITEGDRADSVYIVVEGALVVERGQPPKAVARLEQNSFFGELALLDDTPRSASVTALTDTELLVLPRELVVEICDRHPAVLRHLMRALRTRLVATLTATSPLFAAVPESARADLIRSFRYREIASGTTFIREGESIDTLFLILTGRAEVSVGGRTMATLTTGEVLGETAFLNDARAEATVRSIGRVSALALPAAGLRRMLAAHPDSTTYLKAIHAARRANLARSSGSGAVESHNVRRL